jgi:hypothetical protein
VQVSSRPDGLADTLARRTQVVESWHWMSEPPNAGWR